MANWSLKVNVNEIQDDRKGVGGESGWGDNKGWGRAVQEIVDSNPRCSPVTVTALPFPEPSSQGDIAFVC